MRIATWLTTYKNLPEHHACFVKNASEGLKKDVALFRNRTVHEFSYLKALITLEQVNTSVVEKKRIFRSKTSMVRLTGRALYSFIVCKWAFDEHAVYFRQWLKWRTSNVHQVFALWQWCNFSRIKALDFRLFIHVFSINLETNSRIRYKK